MRCEHCGRNEATFHYRSIAEGRVEETHLCADCAAELGYLTGIGEGWGEVLSLLPGLIGGADLWAAPQLTPAARRTLQLTQAPDEAPEETEPLLDEEESRALRRERERNALNVRLAGALEAEDYEQAARLRDELKELDKRS